MAKDFHTSSTLMARLTISALEEVSRDTSCWTKQEVHRAVLVSGLSVLLSAAQLLDHDLDMR